MDGCTKGSNIQDYTCRLRLLPLSEADLFSPFGRRSVSLAPAGCCLRASPTVRRALTSRSASCATRRKVEASPPEVLVGGTSVARGSRIIMLRIKKVVRYSPASVPGPCSCGIAWRRRIAAARSSPARTAARFEVLWLCSSTGISISSVGSILSSRSSRSTRSIRSYRGLALPVTRRLSHMLALLIHCSPPDQLKLQALGLRLPVAPSTQRGENPGSRSGRSGSKPSIKVRFV